MSKKIIHIPPMLAQSIALCYQNIQSAKEYAQSIYTDRDCPRAVSVDFVDVSASLASPLARIDKRIPKATWSDFSQQVKENDSLRLENIKTLYVRMTPEKQQMLELMAEGILKDQVTIESLQAATSI